MFEKSEKVDLEKWAIAGCAQEGKLEISWLGQAGFILKAGPFTLGIDLYLSDSLAQKYKGHKFPHIRMMGIPLDPVLLSSCSAILSTHGHTDHMDGETLEQVFLKQQGPLFICPRSQVEKAKERHVPCKCMVLLNAGEEFSFREKGLQCTIIALPSAHENLDMDSCNNYQALGYVIKMRDFTIYHSGDCIPYKGLEEMLRPLHVDLCLLPVNGRSDELTANGIAGNFTLYEAMDLCKKIGCPCLIPHHFGMFDFNTIAVEEIHKGFANNAWREGSDAIVPESGFVYTVGKE
jgi:L-ascorbate metabolism protein UlaG (beta-lactamase superfamily)